MTAPSYVSGSRLGLAMKCGASAVLPRVFRVGIKDRIGSALHEHLHDRTRMGIAGAATRLDEIAARWELEGVDASIFRARAMHFEWTPPRGALAELALCLCEDGEVRVVEGGRGVYTKLPAGALLPMQIDAMWSEPAPLFLDSEGRVRCPEGSILWVIDAKTGDERYVDPVERNAQTLAGAVLGAKFTGATAVLPAIVFWRKGPGIWDVPEHYLDETGVAAGEAMIRSALERVADNRRRYLLHEPLDYTVGLHCDYCDAQTYCAAKVGALKRYLEDPRPLAAVQLTPMQATSLAELEGQFTRFAEAVKEALTAYSDANGPIPMTAGRQWGPYDRQRSTLDPEVARTVLTEEIGERSARAAFAEETSAAAIERAIKASHKRDGITRQAASAMRRVMARIREAGGAELHAQRCYGMHVADDEDNIAPRELAAAITGAAGDFAGVPIDGDQ